MEYAAQCTQLYTASVRVLLCVSSVPASCVHKFVSCPRLMWSLVNSCPAVFVSLSMIYLCIYSSVCSVWFRLVYLLLPVFPVCLVLPCLALSALKTIIWVYVLVCMSLFLPAVCTVTASCCSSLTFIYIALYTMLIVSKQLYSVKQESNILSWYPQAESKGKYPGLLFLVFMYVFTFTFTFNHLADAFIQSDVQMRRTIEAIRPSREQQYTSAMTSLS